MSSTCVVVGFKPADEKWQRMKTVWDACKAAGIDPPKDVTTFFNHEPPDDAGVRVEISGIWKNQCHECCKEWGDDSISGFEIDVTKLPKDVTVLRFINSW